MYENKSDFGRCSVCYALTSMDSKNNHMCDYCWSERNITKIDCAAHKRVEMPTKEDLDNGFNPFDF